MYLDPGTGSVVLQALLAALLGLGVFVKLFWGKITAIFTKKNADTPVDETTEEQI
ncbi:MAG: hypothetical protein RBT34_05610 [Anaerolineaceae bacterium]|jgi:hypothetical protein|nr:hypothetical protein [Anaerolineaceae bacterium]